MRIGRRDLCVGTVAALALLAGPGASLARSDETLLVLRNPALNAEHGEIRFTRSDLVARDWHTIKTGNQFISGVGTFRGPMVSDVLSLIGRANATKARLTAVNQFYAEVEIAEFARFGAILAMEMNGRALSLRDFGPIWVMYPIDDHSELQDSRYNSRLVWQLSEIELF